MKQDQFCYRFNLYNNPDFFLEDNMGSILIITLCVYVKSKKIKILDGFANQGNTDNTG